MVKNLRLNFFGHILHGGKKKILQLIFLLFTFISIQKYQPKSDHFLRFGDSKCKETLGVKFCLPIWEDALPTPVNILYLRRFRRYMGRPIQ
jgi:hypothetical protein